MTDQYNAVAVKYAEQIHQARMALGKQLNIGKLQLEQLIPPGNRAAAGVALEYERMGNVPVSAELLARADAAGIEFEHLGTTLGTVLHNLDLKAALSPELVQLIRDTLLERKVIFFRDQHLSENEQVAFARNFGELDAFPFGKPGKNPYILEIIHGKSSPGTENGWHTDVTWMEQPSLGSIAQLVEAPPVGGDTLFSDSHACLLGLPVDLRERIEHLHGINDYRLFIKRGAVGLPDELVGALKKEIPFGVSHPLVRTHPETGKAALYIHGGFLRHDSLFDVRTGEALEKAESEAIVEELLTQHDRPEYVCRFKWQQGSIAFWDNRAVQHYAASDYYPNRRVLRRVTVSGDKPF
ncbi:MAG: TauD/TfdA family dioxygenase [Gammaproteobacteria bacterium]|nr:TauD/TfdA family dioxygenase [Gammaproteobacteria bacterium]